MMTEADQKFIAKWDRTRVKGKPKFVAIVAIIFTVVFPVFTYLVDTIWPMEEPQPVLDKFLTDAAMGLVLGVFLGFQNWRMSERKYEKITNQENN